MMTSTRLPEVDGKYSSTTKISLKETHDLQQDRTAYDEYYRAVMWLAGYVPDDFPMQKVKEKNVKKWALCRIYSTDTIREGYCKSSIKNHTNCTFEIKIPRWVIDINIQSLAGIYRLSFL